MNGPGHGAVPPGGIVYPQSYYPVGNEVLLDPSAYYGQQQQPQQQQGPHSFDYVSQGWDDPALASSHHSWNALEQQHHHPHPHSHHHQHHQHHQHHPHLHQQHDHHQRAVEESTPSGSFFVTGELTPRVFGYPINALAFDKTYAAMYVASTTQSMSSTRWRSHRASMLVTHSTTDGMMYSSCGGHPEASASVLQSVYECMYGISRAVPLPPGRQHIPSHAYRPPYGGCNIEAASIGMLPDGSKQQGHIGINQLLPLSGYVASVSPSAVRIHSRGGLQIHDQPIEGMICGTFHPLSNEDMPTHITVGGTPQGVSKYNKQEVHCIDLWQGLRIVSSRAFKDTYHAKVGVTAMATSHERGSIVAGCSDGNIRLLDGSLRELATVKGHAGGISSMAVSDDGMLIATTGYGSRPSGASETSLLYSFPDPSVLIYDIRYLGRGGMPHPFLGMRGAPTFLSFLPDIEGVASNRLVVASGQPGGGLEIMAPFEAQSESTSCFLLPQLDQGEAISTMVQADDSLALGTSAGRVLQYRMAGYNAPGSTKTQSSSGMFVPSGARSPRRRGVPTTTSLSSNRQRPSSIGKQPLDIAPFVPPIPPVSLDPNLLLNNDPNIRNGANDRVRSLFSTYTLRVDPKLTTIGNSAEEAMAAFGAIACQPMMPSTKREVAPSLIKEAPADEGDFLVTIPTSKLELDLLANHNKTASRRKSSTVVPNPNKLLYTSSLASICYQDGLNRRRKSTRSYRPNASAIGDFNNQEVPSRYRLKLRSHSKSKGAFDPADFNDTGLFPGWDYPPTMPNAFAAPVMLLLYFVPEVRLAVMDAQYNEKVFASKAYERALAPELGFVFHQIESLSRFGLLHPAKHHVDTGRQTNNNSKGDTSLQPRIGAWVPSNFLTALSTMPEADQLQILDGSPAAVDPPRRPEAFYRFLAYHLDKELTSGSGKNQDTPSKLMDSLHGIDFVSINQFITGSSPSSQSSTRALTVDLVYETFSNANREQQQQENKTSHVRFGEVLQHALCRETRLRAWNQKSKAYETIVQRKIATSLPKMLTLSCACAGRKEEDGLWAWRGQDGISDAGHWLPEMVEVELEADGNVIVRELVMTHEDGKETWATFSGKSSLPDSQSKIVTKNRSHTSGNGASKTCKFRYRLEAVLSFVRDNARTAETSGAQDHPGHHVLHVRIPRHYRSRVIKQQRGEAAMMISRPVDPQKLVLTSDTPLELFQRRSDLAGERLDALKEKNQQQRQSPSSLVDDDDWVLFNGFVVSSTCVDDARAFHVSFKEPCLVVFRAVDEDEQTVQNNSTEGDGNDDISDVTSSSHSPVCRISAQVLNARSLSSNSKPTQPSKGNNTISPSESRNRTGFTEGSLIAFDAEFVAVQEEESTLTETGSKVILRETRHALARISVLDCKNKSVFLDDHVLPREHVVDYLTRFSGIVAQDLDPARTKKSLISTRSAYLKLRYLMEQGCIFVGHGLRQDFATVNLVVPPYQISDTVELFHQPGMRYISLRFLANHVLGRDMQQDTHDSVEDALAAYELVEKALEWKQSGIFQKKLQDLYAYGQKTDWKIGVDSVS